MISNKDASYRGGNRVCRSMRKSVRANESPLDSKQILKIKAIYNDCRRFAGEETPLIYASRMGYSHIVWGFVKCAKQTNTNLHTGATGEVEVQNFLWYHNDSSETALHVAVKQNYINGVAMQLLENASLERLMSERDQNGKAPISMFDDSIDDMSIISILKKAKRENMDSQTSVSLMQIVDIQETKVYSSSIMDVDSYPKSHKSVTRTSLEKLNNGILEVTPSNNTILHLVSMFGDVKYVNDIIKEHPSLLYSRNSEGETPAYIAAREGHMDILETMIHYFKMKNDDDIELLVKRTTDNNTALHVAIQNHHVGVVFLLIKQIPKLANHINILKESPIYIAAERRYNDILKLMMEICKEKSFEGPNGKTSLHAAAISSSLGSIEYLLSENRDLLYKPDNHHRTPLQYAVHHNNRRATERLLKTDTSLGYKKVMEDGIESSLVHIASSQGHSETMKFLISKCPRCSEITDGKGRNILHVAIDNKNTEVIEYIFQDESFTFLINQKDNDGNTPIHIYMASELDMIEKVMDSRVDINIFNNEGNTPLDVASSRERRNRLLKAIQMGIPVRSVPSPKQHIPSREEFDARYKHVNQLLVVVTLIATATFAAAFTIPGGFDGNEGSKQAGMPILLKKAAFQVFMVTNTLAFSCSCASLIGYVNLLTHFESRIDLVSAGAYKNVATMAYKYISRVARRIRCFTVFAVIAMSVAFATGIYVVLTPYPGLAISLCFITLLINGYSLCATSGFLSF